MRGVCVMVAIHDSIRSNSNSPKDLELVIVNIGMKMPVTLSTVYSST